MKRTSSPRRRWWLRALLLLAVLLVADYALYPRLARPGGHSLNRGENGLWLRYHWYFGRRSEDQVRDLARRLQERQIRLAYFHVRHISKDGSLRYRYPMEGRRLVAALQRDAPEVKVIAWVFAGNRRLALKGVREGLADSRAEPAVFAGVAPFADYTTQPREWETYRELWLSAPR